MKNRKSENFLFFNVHERALDVQWTSVLRRPKRSGDRTLFEAEQDSNNAEIPGVTPGISVLLASTRGFEPPTYRLGGGRSILLSYVD